MKCYYHKLSVLLIVLCFTACSGCGSDINYDESSQDANTSINNQTSTFENLTIVDHGGSTPVLTETTTIITASTKSVSYTAATISWEDGSRTEGDVLTGTISQTELAALQELVTKAGLYDQSDLSDGDCIGKNDVDVSVTTTTGEINSFVIEGAVCSESIPEDLKAVLNKVSEFANNLK